MKICQNDDYFLLFETSELQILEATVSKNNFLENLSSDYFEISFKAKSSLEVINEDDVVELHFFGNRPEKKLTFPLHAMSAYRIDKNSGKKTDLPDVIVFCTRLDAKNGYDTFLEEFEE